MSKQCYVKILESDLVKDQYKVLDKKNVKEGESKLAFNVDHHDMKKFITIKLKTINPSKNYEDISNIKIGINEKLDKF